MLNTVYAIFRIADNKGVRKQDSIKILLGKNIRAFRKDRDMTQSEFADAVSCDVKYLGDVENGWFYPSSELLERIVEFLNIPVCKLFTDFSCPETEDKNKRCC